MFFWLKSLHTLPLQSVPSYLSISLIPHSPNPPSCLLGQFDCQNIKNSSAFRNYDRNMTGRQEYDRTKDRQRTLDKYMINTIPSTSKKILVDRYKYQLLYIDRHYRFKFLNVMLIFRSFLLFSSIVNVRSLCILNIRMFLRSASDRWDLFNRFDNSIYLLLFPTFNVKHSINGHTGVTERCRLS
jgi:hypothetical protein